MGHRGFEIKVAAFSIVAICALALPALAQQPSPQESNPLIDGKLMYVGRMPENIDSWIVADLRTWGKYKPTRDSEGVDLVMEAQKPETRMEYEMKHGVPQPKSVDKRRGPKRIMFTIVVTDWVTGRRVWEADILDRKEKNGRRETTTGSRSEVYARGLSTQQLAEAILRALRSYVMHLAPEPGAAAASAPPA
ncbi:MAG TPA: hypothetical protein VMV34_07015 [Terriglobia bacterium]|nr:hypothetical protein [Terriglobia bacterium]